MNIFIYAKNICIFFFIFFYNLDPSASIILVIILQIQLSLTFSFLFFSMSRRTWIPSIQELFLTVYFCIYLFSYQHNEEENHDSLFMIFYLIGLSILIFGLFFELVDDKKKDWIPREAW